jgi:hypothetical protein
VFPAGIRDAYHLQFCYQKAEGNAIQIAIGGCALCHQARKATIFRPSYFSGEISLSRGGSAIVAEIAIYLLSLLLARESLENISAMLQLFGGVAHFSKFYPTGHSVEPNHICCLLLFGDEVSSVVFEKTPSRIVWDFRHLEEILI